MKRLREEGPVVKEIGDLMLARVRPGVRRAGGARCRSPRPLREQAWRVSLPAV